MTFNVASGHTEYSSNMFLNPVSAQSRPVVFQKSGTGANPLVTASPGTNDWDAIIGLCGADYVTIDGISIRVHTRVVALTTHIEYGIALLQADSSDGCQGVTIRNCDIRMAKEQVYHGPPIAVGIIQVNSYRNGIGGVYRNSAGVHRGNEFVVNVISGAVWGIVAKTSTGGWPAADTARLDVDTRIVDNQILDFGIGFVTALYYDVGIECELQRGVRIVGNLIQADSSYVARNYGIWLLQCSSSRESVEVADNTIRIHAMRGYTAGILISDGPGWPKGSHLAVTENIIEECNFLRQAIGSAMFTTFCRISGNIVRNNTMEAMRTRTAVAMILREPL